GYEHADPAPDDVPLPDSCPRLSEVLAKVAGREPAFWEREWGALDVRYVGDSRPGGALADAVHPARARVWMKTNGALPDERRMHQAALAYASDLTLLAVTTVPHGVFVGLNVQAASIDHALWFHRPFRADDWLLFDQASPSASGGLGLSTARLFQEKALVADVAQEGLIRPIG
ncbi:MAG TPA: acyl-CoA thioesterase II, partial [Propionibacteriaceae bacterium]|nr:acyl-CoA thioesterase II [Propionibacteriaceae bacterium]